MSLRSTRIGAISAWVFAAGLTGAHHCEAQMCGTMKDLGLLPGGTFAEAMGVSADGAVVVGRGTNASGLRGWRWTDSLGMHEVGYLGGSDGSGFIARANGVSADGTIVVGAALNPWNRRHAFRWSQVNPNLDLGSFTHPFSAGTSEAFAVSADGTTVVGSSDWLPTMSSVPFRWTAEGGLQDLELGPGVEGTAYAVSADGSVVVGTAAGGAFRWTQEGGAIDLGMLPGRSRAWATSVSADGSVVVGWARVPDQAFRWTQAGGLESLGVLPGYAHSVATGVSADGSVVVGYAFNGWPIARAFRWTATSGMQDIGTLGGDLRVANAVSADGRTIVGYSTDSNAPGAPYKAFRWTAEPSPADYDGDFYLQVIDLLDFIDDFGTCQGQSSPCGHYGNPDINGDGMIDVLDFLDYMDAFGQGC